MFDNLMEYKNILAITAYIIVLLIPILVCYLIRKTSISFHAWLKAFLFSWVVMVTSILMLWLGYDWYLEYRLDLLDLDGDGFHSNEEISLWTQQELKIEKEFYSDGGRNVFAVFIFPIFAFIYSIVITCMYWIITYLKFRHSFKKLSNSEEKLDGN